MYRRYRDEIWIAFYDNRGTLSHQVFPWKEKKKKGSKERRSWSVKEVTRTQANEAKGVNDPSRIPGLTRIIVFHRLGVTPW